MTVRPTPAKGARRVIVPLFALLLASCATPPHKPAARPATPPRSSSATAATPTPRAPSKQRKPWKSLGPYTAGGLYAPGVADSAPDEPDDIANLAEPVPRAEPPSRYGNRSPYVVLGKSYRVLPTASGYLERGIASWYGTKFDGRATSNFESYDMYQFTAAHKTLPLPSYARVTNLDNGRSVVVRVNDRGPFHEGRLIDLSYAAAVRLGVNVHGTAHVEVRGIDPGTPLPPPPDATARRATPAVARPAPPTSAPAPRPAPAVVVEPLPPAAAPDTDDDAADTAERLPANAVTSPIASAPQAAALAPAAIPPRDDMPAAAPPPVTVRERPPIDGSTHGFLQIASYGDRANAERMLARLRDSGIAQAELVSVQIDGQVLWRVHVGPLSADEAGRVAERLDALGFGNPPFFKD